MSSRVISRIQRLLVDPLWICATDSDVADELGVRVEAVKMARDVFLSSREVRGAVSDARRTAIATGYTGRVWSLISDALKEYEDARKKVA